MFYGRKGLNKMLELRMITNAFAIKIGNFIFQMSISALKVGK